MSAALVRKALDETSVGSEGKLGQLSRTVGKKFKPQQKKRKLSQEKILKQNLKILKALDVKISSKSKGPATKIKDVPPPCRPEVSSSDKIPKKKAKKSKSKKQEPNGSLFTEEDFEKFEKEYFVS